MSMPLRAALAAAILLSAPQAQAHAVADPNKGIAGNYFRTAIRITHGCHGAPTVAVKVAIPEGVLSVKAQPKPGWTIAMTKRELAQPIAGQHGHPITHAVTEVEWRGGPLGDEEFDEFGLSMRLPAQAGRRLWFAVTQTCTEGEIRWSDVPAEGQPWGSVPNPAPFVTLEPPR
jgi:periplasmic copper chaperone A